MRRPDLLCRRVVAAGGVTTSSAGQQRLGSLGGRKGARTDRIRTYRNQRTNRWPSGGGCQARHPPDYPRNEDPQARNKEAPFPFCLICAPPSGRIPIVLLFGRVCRNPTIVGLRHPSSRKRLLSSVSYRWHQSCDPSLLHELGVRTK